MDKPNNGEDKPKTGPKDAYNEIPADTIKGHLHQHDSIDEKQDSDDTQDEHKQSGGFIKKCWNFVKDERHAGAVVAIFTFVISVTGIAYTIFSFMQWRVMRGQLSEIIRQYPELQKSADAAKKSADTAEHSFQTERRRAEDMEEAICTLNGGGMTALDNLYPVYITNSGKVTARDIEAHIEVSLNTLPSNRKIRVLVNTDISLPELAREKSTPTQKLNLPLSSREWQNIADTKQAIVQTAKIKYENGFERIISDAHCDIWLYYRTPQDKLNPIQGRGTDCKRLPELLAGVPRPQKP
jgi:hypothetical protein